MHWLALTSKERNKDLGYLFDYGLIVKAIEGGIEAFAGLLVLLVPSSLILKIVTIATAGEVAADPDDPVATTLREAAHSFAIHTHFLLSAYLILRGVLKTWLSIAMFRQAAWAFPAFVACFLAFGIYEAYRGLVRGETLLAAFALFDFAMVALAVYQHKPRIIKL